MYLLDYQSTNKTRTKIILKKTKLIEKNGADTSKNDKRQTTKSIMDPIQIELKQRCGWGV